MSVKEDHRRRISGKIDEKNVTFFSRGPPRDTPGTWDETRILRFVFADQTTSRSGLSFRTPDHLPSNTASWLRHSIDLQLGWWLSAVGASLLVSRVPIILIHSNSPFPPFASPSARCLMADGWWLRRVGERARWGERGIGENILAEEEARGECLSPPFTPGYCEETYFFFSSTLPTEILSCLLRLYYSPVYLCVSKSISVTGSMLAWN